MRARAAARSPMLLTGIGVAVLAAVAWTGYRNMQPAPAYVTVDSWGFGPMDIAREMLPALTFAAAGFIAWHRRPRNRVGLLMVLIGASILLRGLQGVAIPPVVTIGIWGSIGPGILPAILLGILVLVYPTGRFTSRVDRWWAFVALLYFATVQLAWTLYAPTTRDSTQCGDCRPAFILGYNDYIRLNLRNLSVLIFTLLAIALVLLVVRRWARSSGPARRVMVPVWLAGLVVAIAAVSSSILLSSISAESTFVFTSIVPNLGDFLIGRVPIMAHAFPPWLLAGSMMLVPCALLWGLLRSHLSQSAISALAIELGRTPGRLPLVESMRRALGDPSLELALWSRPARMYVTSDGVPMMLQDAGNDRAVTPLDGADGPLAAMVHDPALGERQRLIEGVSAVARLALENERLHAEVKAQLEEVRASRQRLVSAADDERRRVERDIHDGAQQRLVSLSLALGMAQARAADAPPEVVATLAEAERELKQAIGELRELARGVHPAILTEAGLGPALESVAEHAPFPVALTMQLDGPIAPIAEATAYFVTAEALTNVAKHASATAASITATVRDGWLSLRITDDGTGGADPARGSGLRGLFDRVAAVGGTLRVADGPDGGTCLEAELPCG